MTDDNGFFILEDMPAPAFFVHVDGSTATNAPPGTQYATVGKLFHSIPGQSSQLTMDGQIFNIYLPPMDQGDIQPLSPTANTDVGFGAAGKAKLVEMFPLMDPAVWDLTEVTFPPNSAVDDTGTPATQATIIPVPSDRLPAPLPPFMNHQLDIAVIAPGASNFDEPAPACFPNLPDPDTGEPLPPGAKSALTSFNHDTGHWEIVGPMTVSQDGQLVCTDPGVGIRAPGWHGTQPGSPPGRLSPPKRPCITPDCITSTLLGVADCALSFVPGGGCGTSLAGAAVDTARDCYINAELGNPKTGCYHSATTNAVGALVGCLLKSVPGIGQIWTCGNAFVNILLNCTACVGTSQSAFIQQQTPTSKFEAHLNIVQAFREYLEILYGSPVWTTIEDPSTAPDSPAVQVQAILDHIATTTAGGSKGAESILVLKRTLFLPFRDLPRY